MLCSIPPLQFHRSNTSSTVRKPDHSNGSQHILLLRTYSVFVNVFRAVVDLVLVMSVNPGFGGQKFIETQIDKIKQIKAMCNAKGVNPWLEVDGGIGPDNAHLVTQAGANAIVAGSAVFKADDYKSVIDKVRSSREAAVV